jgi:alkyl hydroperoxide reductase subunit AhpF
VKLKVAYLQDRRPHCELGGIAVDWDMRTNLHGVSAAGDCTVAIDFSTGNPLSMRFSPTLAWR